MKKIDIFLVVITVVMFFGLMGVKYYFDSDLESSVDYYME